MAEGNSHKFGFALVVTIKGETIKIEKNTTTYGQLERTMPPSIAPHYHHIIFDILRSMSAYNVDVNIESSFSYLCVRRDDDRGAVIDELVCLDAIVLTPTGPLKIGSSIPLPAGYRKRTIKCSQDPAIAGLIPGQATDADLTIGQRYRSILDTFNQNPHQQAQQQPPPCINLTAHDLKEDSKWYECAGLVNYKCVAKRNGDEITFMGEMTLRRQALAEIAGVVPIPAFPSSDIPARHAVVSCARTAEGLRVSEAVMKNLEQLSNHLQFRDTQISWIIGEPGSGKDIFAQAMHFGSTVSRNRSIQTRSTAGMTLQEFNQRLFSSERGEKCLVEQQDDGGTIFLDEFDKVSAADAKALYGSMLRILEAKEYIKATIDHASNSSTFTAMQYRNVNWIFAGAFSQVEPDEHVPRDFWSRLTGLIKLENPLEGDEGYAASLFVYFYFSEAIAIARSQRSAGADNLIDIMARSKVEQRVDDCVIQRILGLEAPVVGDRVLAPSPKVAELARKFSGHVFVDRRIHGSVDSTRSIRQATRAAFFAIRHRAIQHQEKFKFDKAAAHALKEAQRSLGLSRGNLG